MATQIISNLTVCSTACSGLHERKHQSSVLVAFFEEKPTWWQSTCSHKCPVMRICKAWRHHSILWHWCHGSCWNRSSTKKICISYPTSTERASKFTLCCCLVHADFTHILQDYFGDTRESIWFFLSQHRWSKPEDHMVVLILHGKYVQNLNYTDNGQLSIVAS